MVNNKPMFRSIPCHKVVGVQNPSKKPISSRPKCSFFREQSFGGDHGADSALTGIQSGHCHHTQPFLSHRLSIVTHFSVLIPRAYIPIRSVWFFQSYTSNIDSHLSCKLFLCLFWVVASSSLFYADIYFLSYRILWVNVPSRDYLPLPSFSLVFYVYFLAFIISMGFWKVGQYIHMLSLPSWSKASKYYFGVIC